MEEVRISRIKDRIKFSAMKSCRKMSGHDGQDKHVLCCWLYTLLRGSDFVLCFLTTINGCGFLFLHKSDELVSRPMDSFSVGSVLQ